MRAAEALKENGAKRIIAAVTHPVLCGDALNRIQDSDIEELIVTDTIPLKEEQKFEKLTVLSVAHIFGEAIDRIYKGESVTALF